MVDEIDLRVYVRALLSNWKLISACTLLAAVAAGIISMLLPPIYEATVLISVAQPPYSLRLDNVSAGRSLPGRTYTDLALSDGVLAEVVTQQAASLGGEVSTASELRANLGATTTTDQTLVRLAVRDTQPQRAAEIANAWAAALVARSAILFGNESSNLVTYEQQLAQAKTDLAAADQALAAFQAENQVALLQFQVESAQSIVADYLARQHQIDLLRQDVTDFSARLRTLNADAPVSAADDVAVLMLVAQIYGGNSGISSNTSQAQSLPLQVQIAVGSAAPTRTVAEQLAVMDELLVTLNTRAEAINGQMENLTPKVLALQGQLGEARVQEAQLTRARNLAETRFLTLSAQVDQARLAAQEAANSVRVASAAVVPTERVSPRRTLNVLVGAALGFLVGVLAAFARYWWTVPASRPARVATA